MENSHQHNTERIILNHDDLIIKIYYDKNGRMMFVGKSEKYKPYRATASTLLDCFFCFDIQLAEQKKIVVFLNELDIVKYS